MSRSRANGEGSIYPFRNGFAAYAWVETPRRSAAAQVRVRQDPRGRAREVARPPAQARRGPVATRVPTLGQYLDRWLSDVVMPSLAPATSSNYAMFVRLYIAPKLGSRRLDKLTVREVQTWFTKLKAQCQCCAQGKDAARPVPRCCAIGRCCAQVPSEWTAHQALGCSAARSAMRSGTSSCLGTSPALVRVSLPRRAAGLGGRWTRRERSSSRRGRTSDPYYVAYVLILVLGLRRGEALGLAWADVDTTTGEAFIALAGPTGGRAARPSAHEDSLVRRAAPAAALCSAALAAHRSATRWDRAGRSGMARPRPDRDDAVRAAGRPPELPSGVQGAGRSGRRPEITVHAAAAHLRLVARAMDVHPRVAMQILRHSQIAVTMNVYSEVSTEDTREALRRLGERLGGEAS